MRAKGPIVVGFLIVLTLMLGAMVACERKPTPAPAPSLVPAPKAAPTPAPTPVATPATPLAVGIKIGERFHDIHTKKLQLKCETCHTKGSAAYNDPLAQAVNPVDNRACLSCHKEGGSQPFYGEEWNKAKVGR